MDINKNRSGMALQLVINVLLILECAEELPTEKAGRAEATEEGFRGTRLLMGGLPSFVESFTAHAVQSGFVPPLSASNNGFEPMIANLPTTENQDVKSTYSREASDELMDTELDVPEERPEQERATDSTSAEGSADSHPLAVDAAGPDEGPHRSLNGNLSSVDMEIMEQEADKISGGRHL